jgi:hypothetical protein
MRPLRQPKISMAADSHTSHRDVIGIGNAIYPNGASAKQAA